MLCLQILASDVIKLMTGVSQLSDIPLRWGGGGGGWCVSFIAVS